MPRIYAQNPNHSIDWPRTPFINGAAALAAGANTDYFTENSTVYTVDGSKHKLELWDRMSVAELDELFTYLGGTAVSTDSKYQKIRKIEGSLSTKYIATLTVASAAATTGTGKTKITITDPGDYDYYVKTGKTTAPSLLWGDVPDSTWQKLTLVNGVADEIAPNADTDDMLGTVRVSADGTVIGIASDSLVVKS